MSALFASPDWLLVLACVVIPSTCFVVATLLVIDHRRGRS